MPSNKCGKVFAAGDRHVDAVYAHDRRLSIIRTSHYNLIPDIGCGVRMHDDIDNVHRHDDLLAGESAAMWACDKKDRAVRLTADAAKVLSRQGYQATVVEPLPCVPRFHGPASIAPKVFVPCLQVTTPEGTFTGKVAFNGSAKPSPCGPATASCNCQNCTASQARHNLNPLFRKGA